MNTDTTPHHDMSLPKPASAETPSSEVPVVEKTALQPSSPQETSAEAADIDTIEKGWVMQVEQLFHAYGDDPYALTQQFAELKREYIAKRYGKVIKKAGE